MGKAAVAGVGQLPFKARYADKTYFSLAFEAVKQALDDAGLSPKDVGSVVYAIYSEPLLRQGFPDIFLHDYLGMQGKTGLKVAAAEATGGHGIYAAVSQIASGMADCVLLLAVQKVSDLYDFHTGSRGDGLLKAASLFPEYTWERPVVPNNIAHLTGTCLVPHMDKYGSPTVEQIARIAVKNHQNALLNPQAQLKLNLTVEDVLNSRIIAWPTTLYECCLYGDGAAALVLVSEEKARSLPHPPVWVTGTALADHSLHRLEPRMLGRVPGVAKAARDAYGQAGIKDPLRELDVVELQDLISGLELIMYEELGLCPAGEGGRLIDEGVVLRDGLLPVNPHGGCVACGHVPGVCEVSSMGDVVLQLQERAGALQVPLHHGQGLVASTCSAASFGAVTIFKRES